MSTEIKRLKQNGKDFVPITIAEAVVVNTENMSGYPKLEITTLDKVLAVHGLSLTLLNTALLGKQDLLRAGAGITLVQNDDNTTTVSCSLTTTIYKIISAEEFAEKFENPSEQYANIIYLVPTQNQDNSNRFTEFICVQDVGSENKPWIWERFGEIASKVDLSDYVTKQDFALYGVMAKNVTLSDGTTLVVVTYDIPTTLYDDMIQPNDLETASI